MHYVGFIIKKLFYSRHLVEIMNSRVKGKLTMTNQLLSFYANFLRKLVCYRRLSLNHRLIRLIIIGSVLQVYYIRFLRIGNGSIHWKYPLEGVFCGSEACLNYPFRNFSLL